MSTKIQKLAIIIVIVVNVISCAYRPKERRLTEFRNNESQILKTFYRMTSDTVEFRRVSTSNLEIILQVGKIFLGDRALTHQRINSSSRFRNEPKTLDSLSRKYELDGWVTKLGNERDVMFIQIVPDSSMTDLESLGFLNLRQDVEGKIDEALTREDLGEWFAGDMGAGGNMLFFVDDWDKAITASLSVLRDEELLDHVVIAKRIIIGEQDWNYEIVYPLEFEGVFNQM